MSTSTGPERSLADWGDVVCATLGIEPDYDLHAILDTAREVAHAVERPAAPLTAFLVGFAAAQAGGSQDDLDQVLDRVTVLAQEWGA
ncbi:DUF6457 domain-containing protein [Mumia quercus]|uniref:DUF6457 domain-containing protein n=1 Tax=Mumia quercus TaxID=2976125 RepID=UPI0021CE2374|nr:DUF6457 domain-containing protein [Mumia quercus]